MSLRTLATASPAILLTVVALAQMVMARTADLSPWKGGGFGMFASADGLPFRSVRLYVSAKDRSEEIIVPLSLDDLAQRAATFPERRAMERLGFAAIAREQRQGREVDTVRVEVWRARVSPTLDVTEELVREMTVAAHEADRARDR